jgi:hypothetical protein
MLLGVFFGSILKLAYWHIARQLKDRYNPKKEGKIDIKEKSICLNLPVVKQAEIVWDTGSMISIFLWQWCII